MAEIEETNQAQELPFFENPVNDNQILLNYQYRFKNGDPEALGNMYAKLFEIAYKNINTSTNKNAKVKKLNVDERKQKAHDAATYLIEQYLKRPGFAITDSVTGYLYKRVLWELNGKGHQNKRDQIVEYTDELPERNGSKIKYKYMVKNITSGAVTIYESAAELYLNPVFKGLRKKRLIESIKTGRKWKNYTFDILEVIE